MTTSTAPAEAPPNRARQRAPFALWILLVPFLVMFAAFFIAPIVYAVVDSLFAQKSGGLGFGPPERVFVFFDNYVTALSNPTFVESLGRLLVFSAIEVPLMVATALVLALLLESGRAAFPRVFRVMYFMPYGVPGVIAALLWGFLYIPATSPIVQGLSNIGISINPLSSDAVLFAIANIALWGFAGYNMLILIAALNAIPSELYEAARLDGASEWHMIWHIKLPLVRPSIILITVFTIIGTLQLFVEPLVLRPLTTAINSDFTPNLAAYNQAFAQGNPNLAAAMAVIVALLGFAFSFGFLRLVNRKENRAW
ncbi:sugar ABC transporter permease [Agromyces atrinae]|uniref:Multiple sugar transport system permease protein n=1 Tax=Agromyces atrinae TaxID=592376 RepID=A0A4Q2M643_9MICO|nr:sugar ABC transporter permease [Agromyces atrinae]MCI2957664.1 sugar ABC transporter permease [Agromyces atrinae]NYD67027.1 multiple sugar transport system permease protein [Agromyces atrinae]RXZ85243.1 sugar ABC transporter permease [Agromyces atrinae]RXZ85351.1 sugar ABC transporter permease [Agromyces atrinae]